MEFNYITSTGIALDDFGNEVRDESGAIIIVPEDDRENYTVLGELTMLGGNDENK